jgi:hypothetical protein
MVILLGLIMLSGMQNPGSVTHKETESQKVIHVFVALCDNRYQGIVKVPALIGNGQDPANNLYWGASFGIKTFFKRSAEWDLIKSEKIDSIILERLIFKNKKNNYYLVADAFNGKYIDKCITSYLRCCAYKNKQSLNINNCVLRIGGDAQLIAYIGHDGLMDFQLNESFENTDKFSGKDCIVLACVSKTFFHKFLKEAKANPLIWTTGLMCPEAYTLHDAITGYMNNETAEEIRTRAAKAYSKYQKCSEQAAKKLLVSGW